MDPVMISCKCGCGKTLSEKDKKGRRHFFLRGHHWRGKKRLFTEEHRQKIKTARCNQIITQEHKLNISKSLKGKKFGDDNPQWRGGRKKVGGYILVLERSHPHCNKHGYVLEHRLVMEKMIGRYLNSEEVVHHKNGVRHDNSEKNLMLFSSHSEHMKHHGFGKVK